MPLPELNLPLGQGPQGQGYVPPTPVEALPVPAGEAEGAALHAGLGKSLGVSLEGRVIGAARGAFGTPQQQAFVPYADAKDEMQQNGYDPNVLPKDGLTRGELDTIKSQQSALAIDSAIVKQSKLSGFTSGTMQFLGGAADPLLLAAGPVLGRIGLAAKGMTAIGRVGAGAAEGATLNGVYDVGLQHFGTAPGDRDISTQQIVQDAAVGGFVGGVLHGALGPRKAPLPERLQTLTDNKQFLQDNIPGIAITSGLRSAEHNAAIGGALHSMHLSGEAMDFVLPRGMTADQAKAMIQQKGLPVTEWLIEKKGDPHSTGDHIHWGWGEKGRGAFGQAAPEAERPELISHDWTQIASPEDLESNAGNALAAASVDSRLGNQPVLSSLGAAREADMLARERQLTAFRTNPHAIMDEHAADVESLESEAWRNIAEQGPAGTLRRNLAPLEPDSALTSSNDNTGFNEQPSVKAFLDTMSGKAPPAETAPPSAAPPRNPEASVLDRDTSALLAEAKARTLPEEGQPHPFDAHMEKTEEAIHADGSSPDMVKAIRAALTCAMSRGLD